MDIVKRLRRVARELGIGIADEAADEIERLRAAFEEIAGQKNSQELKESGDLYGDYETGFDMCVMQARKAIRQSENDPPTEQVDDDD